MSRQADCSKYLNQLNDEGIKSHEIIVNGQVGITFIYYFTNKVILIKKGFFS
jgi:hypothetical protein